MVCTQLRRGTTTSVNKIHSISSPEYQALKRVLAWDADRRFRYLEIPLEERPIPTLERIERESEKRAIKALLITLSDMVSMTNDISLSDLKICDAELKDLQSPTLTRLRYEFGNLWRNTLKRGIIRNELEYYQMREIVIDNSFQIALQDKQRIEEMIKDYEDGVLSVKSR